MTICQGKDIAGLTTKALQSLWSDVTSPALWDKFLIHAKNYNINEPSLPRKRKRPARLLNEGEPNTCDEIQDVKIFYRRIHFDAIQTTVQCIEDRFNQPTLKVTRDAGMLLFCKFNGEEYDGESNKCFFSIQGKC